MSHLELQSEKLGIDSRRRRLEAARQCGLSTEHGPKHCQFGEDRLPVTLQDGYNMAEWSR